MTKPPRPARINDDAVRSWLAVVRAYHQCSELMARRLSTVGVRTAEHEILANLRREPGLSQQALARRCFTAKSHVSNLIGDMESRGWVKRESDPADGRVKRLVLTPAGTHIAERAAAVQAEVVALMTDGVPRDELELVRAAMVEVSRRLESALDPTASDVEWTVNSRS
ncbi:MarR family winged helix-turn-helix transcriptional regulator [Rubrivivax sp. RP6-9]|uniref:MarR family winged helix-turn-helix transcriptional regulator n=1 Tax=Rubrivivax sp. RP6-9 TaxID=3415750 RepID=UPI003CC62D32